jgi:hypothetical protein
MWLKGSDGLGWLRFSGSFAALRMTAETDNGRNKSDSSEI